MGPDEGLRTLRGGVAEGPLGGGCLSIVAESLGTPYAPAGWRGVLFLEDIGTKPYQWDRMLVHLRYAGVLDQVSGIVFGDMGQNVAAEQMELLEAAILHSLREFAGPIAIGLRCGHVDGANLTLPLGVDVRLDCSDPLHRAGTLSRRGCRRFSPANDYERTETHTFDWDLRDGDGFARRDAAGAGSPDYGIGCGFLSTDERPAGRAWASRCMQPYDLRNLEPRPDLVVVGNAISRGNAELEFVLDHRIPFVSMAAIVHDEFLAGRESLVVAGTHGKTTTTSMLAWIYEVASRSKPELAPSFLIGGVAENFGTSFRVRPTAPFVIEGDEYDTAFFDKGPKFLHYFPDAAILTHVEFDHADIYDDLEAVKTAFKRMVNLIPRRGRLVAYDGSESS